MFGEGTAASAAVPLSFPGKLARFALPRRAIPGWPSLGAGRFREARGGPHGSDRSARHQKAALGEVEGTARRNARQEQCSRSRSRSRAVRRARTRERSRGCEPECECGLLARKDAGARSRAACACGECAWRVCGACAMHARPHAAGRLRSGESDVLPGLACGKSVGYYSPPSPGKSAGSRVSGRS
jgi:hypothetical protein